jgi:hypothetical protein
MPEVHLQYQRISCENKNVLWSGSLTGLIFPLSQNANQWRKNEITRQHFAHHAPIIRRLR